MNKVYRVVFSQLTGHWVVTSELAKGKTKSNVMKKAATLAATAGLLASANTALAANCSTNLGNGGSLGGVSCIATGTDEDAKVTLTGSGTVSSGSHGIHGVATGTGEANIEINGTTNINSTGLNAHTILLQSAAGGSMNLSLKGDNTVTLSDQGDTAILLNGNGNATITVDGKLNVRNDSTTGITERDGLEINSVGIGGHATLTHTGEGTISVINGNAVHMKSNGDYGNITVELAGTGTGINLIADGDGHKGLSARVGYTNKNADIIKITTNASIDTNGANAQGIYANAAWVPEDGSVSTSEAAGAVIDITNTGMIRSNAGDAGGSLAHGIATFNKNYDTYIKNNGSIITQGDDASGIRAEQTNDSISGDIIIETGRNSYIETNFINADGIHANIGSEQTGYATNNSGNIIITVEGSIKTTGDAFAEGIHGAINDGSNSGDITLTFKGETIETDGSGQNRGIYGIQDGQGDLTINHFGKEIKTQGSLAHGIHIINGRSVPSADAGDITVNSTGKISTTGSGAHGIHADIRQGAESLLINNIGGIRTSGDGSRGISAELAGTVGSVIIQNDGNIITSGNSASAIYAGINRAGLDSAGITIKQLGGTLSTSGAGDSNGYANSHGIFASTNAKSGDINVYVKNTLIDVKGSNSDGIDVQNQSAGASNLNLNITTEGGEIKALFPSSTASATSNYGIVAIQKGAAAGDINITNNGTKISTGLGQNGLAPSSSTLAAMFSDSTATGNIKILNYGDLSTQGAGASASTIYATNLGAGKIEVLNQNVLTTDGRDAVGVYVSAKTGNIVIENTGTIISKDAAGIVVRADKGNVDILASGNITTGQISDSVGNHGINAYSGEGKVNVNYNDGVIKVVGKDNTATGGGRNIGIAVWDKDLAALGTEGLINLGSTATVDASEGTAGLLIRNNGKGEINIAQGAQVHGGSLTGVLFTSNGSAASHTLNNDGIVDSMNDQAVLMTAAQAGNKLTINNYGTLTGFVTSGAEDTTFSNHSSNSFNIRNFADTDGDLIRDTKAVAISNFGGGNDVFKNELTGTVRLAAVTGERTVDTTSEYVTSGALSINNAGIVQGQLINLNTFENRGTIDLTENKQAGDILVIGGGDTAGTYGGGLFVSDGGTLELDTVLNEGDVNSLSDLLVIDDSTVGAGGATRLKINVVNDTSHLETMGQLTQGEGIKVIESLGTSSANSFKLDKPMAYGLYEYVLGQGSADQNWYLRNMYDKNIPIFNPATGAYLANQTAASSLFMHTLYDRQGHANNIAGGSEKKSSVWVRAATSNAKNQSVNNTMNVDTDSNLIHLGGDIGKWQIQEGNLHLGLMGAYGQTESDVVSKLTNTLAKGKVTGYSVGLYGTWFADEAQGKGLYVDSWAQYGWYKNKISGEAQVNKEDKYDSNSWAVSLEAGYGIHLATRGNTEIMLTPQAQIAYTNYSADDYKDGNNLKITGDKASGIHTRLGARLYGRALEGYSAKPYLEINWLHDTAKNSAQFEGGRGGSMELKDGVPKDKVEGKMGLQGTIAKNWKVWGQVGAQWGGKGYTRYEGQAGLNYQW